MSKKGIKYIKRTLGDPNVAGMFQDIIGGDSSINFPLAYEKYKKVSTNIKRYIALINALSGSQALRTFPTEIKMLESYVHVFKQHVDKIFVMPDSYILATKVADINQHTYIPEEEREAFLVAYPLLQSNIPVKSIILTCEFLSNYKQQIGAINDALAGTTGITQEDLFIVNYPALNFNPIKGLSAFNFRKIYINDRIDESDKRFLLLALSKLYDISHSTYEALVAPDIDVDEFVSTVTSSISEIRKHLPRCNQALDKILNSVSMLKGNFPSYYKDYAISKNPLIIFENFICDVAKKPGKVQPNLSRQFREIISYYRKMQTNKQTDPRLAGILKQVDKNIDELDRRFQQMEKDGETIEVEAMEDLVSAQDEKTSGGDFVTGVETDDKVEVETDDKVEVETDDKVEVETDDKVEVETDDKVEVETEGDDGGEAEDKVGVEEDGEEESAEEDEGDDEEDEEGEEDGVEHGDETGPLGEIDMSAMMSNVMNVLGSNEDPMISAMRTDGLQPSDIVRMESECEAALNVCNK